MYENSIRKHYMTLCFRDNTEVTHKITCGRMEVTFERAVKGGFDTLILDDRANVISNIGFNNSEVRFYQDFLLKNINIMYMEARGEL